MLRNKAEGNRRNQESAYQVIVGIYVCIVLC